MCTAAEIIKIINKCGNETSCLDPIPADLLKTSVSVCLSYEVALENSNCKEKRLPSHLRTSISMPFKKDNFEPNTTNDYMPISNIPFISKLLPNVEVSHMVERCR